MIIRSLIYGSLFVSFNELTLKIKDLTPSVLQILGQF